METPFKNNTSDPDMHHKVFSAAWACYHLTPCSKKNTLNYIVTEVNESFEKLTGLGKSNMIGREVQDIFLGVNDHPVTWIYSFENRLLNDEDYKFEKFDSHSKRWYAVSAFSPKQDFLIIIYEDITERKEVEEALKQSQIELSSIYNSITDCITLIDTDYKILRVNRIVETLFGRKLTGKKCYEVYNCSSALTDNCPSKVAIETKKTTTVLKKTLAGNMPPLEVSSYPILNDNGEVTAIIEHGKDISARLEAEEDIRIHSELLAHMSEGVALIKAENGCIVYTNPRFNQMFGYDTGELEGKPISTIYAPTEKSPAETSWDIIHSVDIKGRWNGEVLNLSKTGTPVWCQVSLSMFTHSKHGRVLLSVNKDLTERKLSEAALSNIAQGISYQTGNAFFSSLATHMANLLNADYAYVAELVPERPLIARTLSFIANGKVADNLEVDVSGTPCEAVLKDNACSYFSGIKKNFPSAHIMAELNVEDYIGTTLKSSSGKRLGLMALMFYRTVNDVPTVKSMLQIFASRASAEVERRHAERALKNSEEKYRMVFENTPLGILHYDNKGVITACNDVLVKILGSSKAKIIGYNMSSSTGNHEATEALNKALQGETGHFEGEYLSISANRVCVLTMVFKPILSDTGDVKGGVGIVEDISRRRRSEKKLRFLSLITEQVSDSIIVTDLNYEIIYANKSIEGLLGYSKEEILGQSPSILNAEPSAVHIESEIYQTISSGNTWRGEHLIMKKDRTTFYCELLFFPLFDLSGNIFAYSGTLRDSSERKQIERTLQEASFELEKNVKERTSELESAVQLLKEEILTRKRAEQELRDADRELNVHARELEESNAALKVLLKQREKDQHEIENNILTNIKHLIQPYLESLKKVKLKPEELSHLHILESNLKEIVSPFSAKLTSQYLGFTPKEIQIADMIKDGKQDKDMMQVLNISIDTVKTHRKNIRKKLGIYGKRLNLRTKLLSLQ